MSATRIEQARLLHSDIELHKEKMAKELVEEKKLVKDRIMQEQVVADLLLSLTKDSQKLIDLYEDEDGVRREELAAISGDNVFSAFYDRLKELRAYHMRVGKDIVAPAPAAEGEEETTKVKLEFSGAESNGQYLDMMDLFTRYINMPMFEKVDYLSFLQRFDKLAAVAKDKKMSSVAVSQEYKKYLEDVVAYLESFVKRTNPLVTLAPMRQMMDEDFETRWNASQVPGWNAPYIAPVPTSTGPQNQKKKPVEGEEAEGEGQGEGGEGEGEKKEGETNGEESKENKEASAEPTAPSSPTPSPMTDAEREANPLYCQACDKLFAKDSVFKAHLPGKKHIKAVEAMKNGKALKLKRLAEEKSLALLEHRIATWAEVLNETIRSTIDHIEKLQSRTYQEIEAERELAARQAAEESDDDDDEDKPLYNPLNLPLAWDGKPIPYWLYKLHGLNIEYKCEICGGYSYWGPRNFERHFKEWRHAYGMRCLGIPNTDEFLNVTMIDHAKALWSQIQKKQALSTFRPEEEEEFEDREGNVYNKKTYETLKRQGII